MTTDELRKEFIELTDNLRITRERSKSARSMLAASTAEAQASIPVHLQQAVESHRALQAQLAEAERELTERVRHFAKALFAETGEKHLPFGVQIIDSHRLEYDAEEARLWAIEKQMDSCLLLDKAKFEAIAKALGTKGAPFVKFITEPGVRIPTSISEYPNEHF